MDLQTPTSLPRLDVGRYLTPVSSPKRKRDDDSDTEENPRSSPMRLRTELPSRSRTELLTSPTSPRSKVSRQLHALSLNKPDFQFSTPVATFGQATLDDSSGSWNTSSPPTDPEIEPTIIFESPVGKKAIPATPVLEPNLMAAPIPISPMPLPSPLPMQSTSTTTTKLRSPPLGSPSPSKRHSPPPDTTLTWSASEITGHNPTDPADDGYGINGIGFRPTPAMAYARSQRRKQQVAEWKTREAKEARQKRMDRRRKASAESDGLSEGSRRVRFVDG